MKEKKQSKPSRIFRPPVWTLVLLYSLAAPCIVAGSILCILSSLPSYCETVGFALLGVAFFILVYAVIATVKLKDEIKTKFKAWAAKYSFTNRMATQYGFRTVVFAIGSLIVSFAFAAFNAFIGITELAIWNGALAAYYLILMTMRAVLVFWHGKKRRLKMRETPTELKIGELKRYRTCGILLLILQFAFSAAIVQMIVAGRGFERSGLVIYVSAIYTVYKVTMAIINTVKARRSDDMTVRAIRSINLVDALVSILALQTAMLFEFGGGADYALENGLVGIAVCAVAAVLGVYMIVNANLKIKRVLGGNEPYDPVLRTVDGEDER